MLSKLIKSQVECQLNKEQLQVTRSSFGALLGEIDVVNSSKILPRDADKPCIAANLRGPIVISPLFCRS